jgi:hypothetical protein
VATGNVKNRPFGFDDKQGQDFFLAVGSDETRLVECKAKQKVPLVFELGFVT